MLAARRAIIHSPYESDEQDSMISSTDREHQSYPVEVGTALSRLMISAAVFLLGPSSRLIKQWFRLWSTDASTFSISLLGFGRYSSWRLRACRMLARQCAQANAGSARTQTRQNRAARSRLSSRATAIDQTPSCSARSLIHAEFPAPSSPKLTKVPSGTHKQTKQ